MNISAYRCLDFLYNVSCVLFPLTMLGDITTVVCFFFLIECSLTAEMSVKHSVTVPSWKMDLTIQCVLCHAEAICKLFFSVANRWKLFDSIIWLFFLNSFFPQIWDIVKVINEMSRMSLAGCLLLYFEECFSLLSRYIGTLYLCTKVGRDAVYSVLLCCINTLSFTLVLHLYKKLNRIRNFAGFETL